MEVQPSPMLKHFTQSLEGIGAIKHFDGAPEKYLVSRKSDLITEVTNRYMPTCSVWRVRAMMSDGMGYRPGRVLLEVTYERASWDDWRKRQIRFSTSDYHTFYSPVKAARYLAGLFGYVEKETCECSG